MPHPLYNSNECGRYGYMGYICDPDHFLTLDQGNYLQAEMNHIYNTTVAACSNSSQGYVIGIAIVHKMNLLGQAVADSAKHFAEYLYQKWQLSESGCESGVLVFLSVGDRYLYILTGSASSRQLTKQKIESIRVNHMNAHLKQ